jgi:hypothetical protein
MGDGVIYTTLYSFYGELLRKYTGWCSKDCTTDG